MAELTYYVAATLDGFIAHEGGTFDGFEWDDEVASDFFAALQTFGTVLMGRKTYEVGLKEGKTSPYPWMRQVVFSRSMEVSPDEAVELVHGDIVGFVRGVKSEADAPIWLCGGADVASTLMDARLIDHVTVKLNPIIFGSGISLVSHTATHYSLDLKGSKVYDCGIVVLQYDVRRPDGAP